MSGDSIQDFKIYRSNKLEKFLPEVVEIIKSLAKEAPLKKKSIVVQSDGMAHWLTLKATSEAGTFANFEFVSPDQFLKNFAEKYFGIKPESVYSKKEAEWELYSKLRSSENGYANGYINGNDVRAFRISRILADLFEQYFVYRPGMMESWLSGKTSSEDPDEKWQFDIFSTLKKDKNSNLCSFAKLFNEKCAESEQNGNYPSAVLLFGISIMNRYQLAMFYNLSRLVPVRLFAMSPSKEFFDSASNKKGAFEEAPKTAEISSETPDTFFRRFCAAGLDFIVFTAEYLPEEIDFSEEPAEKTMLASIQRDILNDAEEPEKVANYNPDKDESIKIASCRDKMREIEVVKDFLLELFNKKDFDLKPEEVAVMAPKINDYVPYITEVFGNTSHNDKTFIPYVISDRTFAAESRIASTFLEMLRLCGSNFEKSKVFSIFSSPLVCAKFNTDEKTAYEIEQLVSKSGVRWGLDTESRKEECAVTDQNTWDFGLSRIMMSFAMPFSEICENFKNIQPLSNISKETLESLSNFVTFAKELFRRLQQLSSTEKSPADFKTDLEKMLDFFFVRNYQDKIAAEEMRHIRNVIDDFAETAGEHTKKLSFQAMRQYLEDELGRDRTGRGFLSAKVNFCSLKPLRALPFKVICLVGMGDGEFPRSENRYAFDLVHKLGKEENAPNPRSVRDNDKYLFIEAIVSTGKKLFISYEAKDLSEDSKKHRSASLPVEILKKYIETKIDKKQDGEAVSLEIKYPVYPFSPEYFEGGKFKTFSQRDFETAKAMFHVEQNKQNPLPKHISEDKTEVCDLDKFLAFFKDPIKNYFKNNLGVTLPDNKTNDGDEELFDYSDSLKAYNIRETYIKTARIIPDKFNDPANFADIFADRMEREGNCPFGAIGKEELKSLFTSKDFQKLNEGIAHIAVKNLGFKDIFLNFPEENLQLKGRITDIDWENKRTIALFPTKKGIKYRIVAMIRHLAANAYGLDIDTLFCCGSEIKTLLKLPQDEAKNYLSVFVKLWKMSKTEMPLFDPGLIEKLYEKLNKDGEFDLTNEALDEEITSFFREKLQKKGTSYSYASPELLLGAEQFMLPNQRYSLIEHFPKEYVEEICKLLLKFYKNTNKRSNQGKK